ncbi:transposase [Belnapia sp. T18]|uniref:Mutator family transposase n=1 Tax=Belnapia arida TaxID=2804533 RepID=A0ABS1U6Y6_9PROT|nr:transposase [Belnapia arida]
MAVGRRRSTGTACAEANSPAAHAQPIRVADQLRPKVPKLASLMDGAEEDVPAFMDVPRENRAKLLSANPIERLNGEIRRRTNVAGIFPTKPPSSGSSVRSCWSSPTMAIQRSRYRTLETIGAVSGTPAVSLSVAAA